jgi:serine protease Do
VITNAHVARQATAVVELHDGRNFRAELVRRDARRDLAAMRIGGRGLEAAQVRDPRTLRAGEVVIAVGNPMGITGAVSTGIAHGAGGRNFLLADIQLAPGNSGGPLADCDGRVLGVNSMVANGMGVAIPANSVERFLNAGRGPRLGITVEAVPVRVREGIVAGLLVSEIERGAAYAAGVRAGDIIIGAAGERFAAPDDLAETLEDVDGNLHVDVLRAGEVRRMCVQLQETAAGAA